MDCCFLTFIAPLLVALITLGGVALWERPPNTPRGVLLYVSIATLSVLCALLLTGYWFEPLYRASQPQSLSTVLSKIVEHHPGKLMTVFGLLYVAGAMVMKILLGKPYGDDEP
jgi:hypothetical protein